MTHLISTGSPHRSPDGCQDRWQAGPDATAGGASDAAQAVEQAQTAMARAEQLSTLAILAAGLPHEISSPMLVARSHLEWLQADLPVIDALCGAVAAGDTEALAVLSDTHDLDALRQRLHHSLDESQRALRHVGSLVRQVQTYVRPDVEGTVVDVAATLAAAVQMVRIGLGGHRPIAVTVGPLPPLTGRPGPLQQIVVNLLVNACQAGERNQVAISAIRRETDLMITVGNDGPMIADDILPLIFEPFFTTKPPGQGTGLGLPVIKRLIESLQGTIEVDSQPTWTEFRVRLPLG